MIQPSTIKLAEILGIPPEDLEEKYKTNSLNLGQIATIANYMRLTPEQTIREFFPGYLNWYRRFAFRTEVVNANCKVR